MDAFGAIYDHASGKPGVSEGFPFGEDVLVLRVVGKIFLLVRLSERPVQVNLKCDPERAVVLRAEHDAIQPGFHMNKKHWNTVHVDGRLPISLVLDLVDHSYDCVVAGLARKEKDVLAELSDNHGL